MDRNLRGYLPTGPTDQTKRSTKRPIQVSNDFVHNNLKVDVIM